MVSFGIWCRRDVRSDILPPASHPRVLSRAIRSHILHHLLRRQLVGMRIELNASIILIIAN
jgi:hypothetical protein